MTKGSILSAKKITKSFSSPEKTDVLKGIDLSISPGETVAIIGPSGCGKSTLLHILGTLESPSSGSLSLFGSAVHRKDVADLRCNSIGFIFQSGNLLEEETLLNNLLIKAKIARRSVAKNSDAYLEAMSYLEKVQLTHRTLFPVKHLSGGEKQRVAIARALMNNPSIILADEPTGNLDANSAKNIQNLLIECCKQLKKSLIVVTHDREFAYQCDRILSLSEGCIFEENCQPK